MSILIPGMKLPKEGKVILIDPWGNVRLYWSKDVVAIGTGLFLCKASELPPHGDLIDRSKIAYSQDGCGFRTIDFAHRAQLENITPVIPADMTGGDADA